MTPAQAREAINLAATAGVAAMSGPPACYLEAERSKPAVGTSWIRVAVRGLTSEPMTHGPEGSRAVTRRGFVIGQCFVPHATDDGAGAAEALAQAFRDLFEGTTIAAVGTSPTNLEFLTGDVRVIGVDGSWVQANAEIPFTYIETV